MNLEEQKKLSEIFCNIAQPLATLIVGIATIKSTKKGVKRRMRK